MAETMQALTYFGESDVRVDTRPKPSILEPVDAIIRIDTTAICEAVQNFKPGDKVLISRCGACENYQKQLYSHCQNGGSWILGYMIDGTLAEYVRTPFADTSLYHLPDTLDKEVAVFLSDALPTGHEIGVQYGEVKPGSDIMIVGAGPVGMGVLLTSQFYSPATITVVDMDDNRLAKAREMGATHTVNPANVDVSARVAEITGGRGVDTAIEAVGLPVTWKTCAADVKEGDNIAVVGVHGKPVKFQLQDMWIKNLTVTTGLVNANTTGVLMIAVQKSDLPITSLATHHFT